VGEGDGISDGGRPLARPKRTRARAARMANTAKPTFDTTRWRIALVKELTCFISSYLLWLRVAGLGDPEFR